MYQNANNESKEHHWIKHFFYKMIPKFNSINKIEKEYHISDQIADIYILLTNNQQIAIEIQCSKISVSEMLRRTFSYTKKGIYTLWVLSKISFPHSYFNPRKIIRLDGAKVSRLERKLHHLYLGRFYYIEVNGETLTPPYPIHIEAYSETRENEFTGNYYEYFYKTIKKVVIGPYIKDLRLLCVENPYLYNLKIARFYDKKLEFNEKKKESEAK